MEHIDLSVIWPQTNTLIDDISFGNGKSSSLYASAYVYILVFK